MSTNLILEVAAGIILGALALAAIKFAALLIIALFD